MRALPLVVLVVAGCEETPKTAPTKEKEVGKTKEAIKQDAAPNPVVEQPQKYDGKPDLILKSQDEIWWAYKKNPAAADQKYLGKVIRVVVVARVTRIGSEDVCFCGQAGTQRCDIALIFRFASKSDVARLEHDQLYGLQGKCNGLVDGNIEFVGTVIPKYV